MRIILEMNTIPLMDEGRTFGHVGKLLADHNIKFTAMWDDGPMLRPALANFADQMELKLRKNDHKTSWTDQPVMAHKRLLMLELAELEVAMDFFTVKEVRKESVDVANFALIINDRLKDEDQNASFQSIVKARS